MRRFLKYLMLGRNATMLVPVAATLANILHQHTRSVVTSQLSKVVGVVKGQLQLLRHTDFTGDVDITCVWKLNGLWGVLLETLPVNSFSDAIAAEGARNRDARWFVESSSSRELTESVSSAVRVGGRSIRGIEEWWE